MVGPLISQKQLTRVLGYLDQGKSDGAELVTGGYRLDRKGYFVHPTVVTNVDPDSSRLFQEEIFGPVVTILPFDDEDEAVALANNSTYGLAATDWTKRSRSRPPTGQADQGRNRRAELPVCSSTTRCPSVATSNPAGATSQVRRASRPTCKPKSFGRRCRTA